MSKGKFVTIEGCEGVGKSTQIKLLRDYCDQNNIDAVFTREPGGTVIAEKIRSIILDINNSKLDDITELLLYNASRRQHITELIIPSLKNGKTVFCDRFSDSTMCYQGFARGIDKQKIAYLSDWVLSGVSIDCTIFLNLTPSLGFLRKGGADKSDRLENESRDFFDRVYEGFVTLAKNEPNRIVSIDASKEVKEVNTLVIEALKQRGIL